MKTSPTTPRDPRRALTAVIALAALSAPAARAQTPEEFKQLKSMVEQMQKTIDAQNSRIAELEKGRTNRASALAGPITAETSPSFRTVEKVAAGEQIGQKSPITY